jgi:hypothetical protein
MLTRQELRIQIERHLEGRITLEDLSAWAEDVFRTEEFETGSQEQIEEILSILRDATDPHRFRWEHPDFELMLEQLGA